MAGGRLTTAAVLVTVGRLADSPPAMPVLSSLIVYMGFLRSVKEDVARTAHIFRGTLAIGRSYDARGRQERCEVGSGEPVACPATGKSRKARVDLWNERGVNDEEKRMVVQ
ncbi:hypothetical protein E2C01_049628 [Portunus trituberculatus]|uniref:Uncharacterized protein n=1 Tax=Portunus trituberculatus TaxID=210409 RepID=A0A5B7GE71_PORTR|nr:hypothetical protein [Portunus trituberculatus]